MKFHHVGFPTLDIHGEEEHLKDAGVFVSGPDDFSIEWLRYEPGSGMPTELKTMAHVAFEVEDLDEALKGKEILIEPFVPMEGVKVAFIKHEGVPIEFMQYT